MSFRPRGAYSLPPSDRRRLIAGTEALMWFGPRMIAELLLEVSDGDTEELLRRLDDYARLAAVVGELGGGDWTRPIQAALRGGRAA
jgi:hypothetical protein